MADQIGCDLTSASWPSTRHTIGPFSAFDSHGQLYVTLTNGGPKEEGRPPPIVCDSEIVCWEMYRATLRTYLAGASEVEWRVLPSIEISSETGKFWVRSRLSVTERG